MKKGVAIIRPGIGSYAVCSFFFTPKTMPKQTNNTIDGISDAKGREGSAKIEKRTRGRDASGKCDDR